MKTPNTTSRPPAAEPRLLLHACCGPCSTHCIEVVCGLGYQPTLYFSNDNLAHECEYGRRLDALAALAKKAGVPLIVPEYDHSAWLEAVSGLEGEPEGGERCAVCFRHNLRKAARFAVREGVGVFTSTLSVSPHKRTAMLFEAGHAVEQEVGGRPQDASADAGGGAETGAPAWPVRFLECDFKQGGGFLRSVHLAREYGLYRQSFCGCEFSERTARLR